MGKACGALVFLLSISVCVIAMVEGESCSTDGLGLCGTDCEARCSAAHEGGVGYCDLVGGSNMCYCVYDCGPPPAPPSPKFCGGGGGECNSCGDSCCNETCAGKYPNASGFCSALGSTLLCVCQYPC